MKLNSNQFLNARLTLKSNLTKYYYICVYVLNFFFSKYNNIIFYLQVKKDETKVRDDLKNPSYFSWRTTKKELRAIAREWAYGDPIPPDMRILNLQELQQVPIDWRMLTPLRPKLRQDEDMFSRLVNLNLYIKKKNQQLIFTININGKSLGRNG